MRPTVTACSADGPSMSWSAKCEQAYSHADGVAVAAIDLTSASVGNEDTAPKDGRHLRVRAD